MNCRPTTRSPCFRARKIQRFLSQPFSVAEVFTGRPGKQVPVADTIKAFKEIIDGKHDDVPEGNFYMKGKHRGNHPGREITLALAAAPAPAGAARFAIAA